MKLLKRTIIFQLYCLQFHNNPTFSEISFSFESRCASFIIAFWNAKCNFQNDIVFPGSHKMQRKGRKCVFFAHFCPFFTGDTRLGFRLALCGQTLLVSLNHLLDHLAADGACLTGSQVAVVALLEVYTDLLWCGITTKIAMILRIMYTNLLVS